MPVPPLNPGSHTEDQTPAEPNSAPGNQSLRGLPGVDSTSLGSTVDYLPGVIFRLDARLQIGAGNLAWEEIIGRTQTAVVGMPFASLLHVDDSGPVQEYLQGVLAGRISAPMIDLRFNRPELAEEWFVLRAAPLPDGGGLACILHDVTVRHQLEFGLRRHEETVHTLYSVTTSAHLNLNEKLQALLALGCRHFGMDAGFLADISGTRCEYKEVYAPGQPYSPGMNVPLDETLSREILRAGGLMEIQNASMSDWAQHPAYLARPFESFLGIPILTGSEVFGTLSFTGNKPRPAPLTSSEKELLRLIALWMGSEIEQEMNTGQLKRYAEEIDRINQALTTTRDQAVEAASIKSEFLATISHEIRTPINAIIGMTDFLLESPLTTAQKEYATVVHDSAGMLLSLINDILDFSKIEAGKLDLESIPFKPLALVETVMDMFAASAYDKGIEIAACVDPSVPETLQGDPTRLRQVLSNLVGNGIKFTESGHVAVSVKCLNSDDKETRLRFEIADTGIGLTETARGRLFQPFTQADGSISRIYGGTGLGLAISRRLVESMGGEISVDSETGKGSLFWFTAAFPPADVPSEAAADSTLLQGKRILLAVDDAAVRDALATYLQAYGAGVSSIDRPVNIVPRLKAENTAGQPFTNVITDLTDPDWSPARLGQALWAETDLNAIRILALTGYGDRRRGTAYENSTSLPAYDTLAKPVKKLSLLACMKQDSKQPAAAAPSRTIGFPGSGERKVDWLRGPAAAAPYVLLAEDNPANLRLATLQLQKLGYRVEQASSGRQAIEMLIQTNHKFSVVLMDCQMSDVDGLSATRIIRKSELDAGRHVPIIAVTANVLPGDREKCLSAGMDDYLSKPINLDLLASVLARWTGIQAEAAIAAAPPPEPVQVLPRPLDAASLEAIRALQIEGQPDFLTELVDIYLRDSVRHIAALHTALDNDQFDELRRAAHSLRGASTNMGAHALAAFLSEVEKQAAFGFVDDGREMMSRVDDEYARVVEALQAERQNGVAEA